MSQPFAVTVKTTRSAVRCAWCMDLLSASKAPRCGGCSISLHAACWTETLGCPTLGCNLPRLVHPRALNSLARLEEKVQTPLARERPSSSVKQERTEAERGFVTRLCDVLVRLAFLALCLAFMLLIVVWLESHHLQVALVGGLLVAGVLGAALAEAQAEQRNLEKQRRR